MPVPALPSQALAPEHRAASCQNSAGEAPDRCRELSRVPEAVQVETSPQEQDKPMAGDQA